MFASDLFFGEKLEVVFKSHDLSLVVDQPSSEVPPSISLFSLEHNGSLGLLRLFVAVKSKARKWNFDRCSNSYTISFQKK